MIRFILNQKPRKKIMNLYKEDMLEAFRMIIFTVLVPIVWFIMGINILFHSIGILFIFIKDKIRGY
jgi:cytochrome c biogenesis protein CcdA